MPELPEVETLKRSLAPHLLGAVITEARFSRRDLLEVCPGEDPNHFTVGSKITGLDRRGKYLLVELDHRRGWAVHFGMSGTMIHYPEAPGLVDQHTHVVWDLRGRGQVCYRAPRRFGRWIMAPSGGVSGVLDDRVGVDALDPSLDGDRFGALLGQSRSPIKSRLLNQRLVSGLGNIYADEALFDAGVDPARRASTLEGRWEDLLRSVRGVLTEAIRHRGTTFSAYRDGQGCEGGNRQHLSVYGRAGQACPRCSALIERSVLGGRGTHCCPSCQN